MSSHWQALSEDRIFTPGGPSAALGMRSTRGPSEMVSGDVWGDGSESCRLTKSAPVFKDKAHTAFQRRLYSVRGEADSTTAKLSDFFAAASCRHRWHSKQILPQRLQKRHWDSTPAPYHFSRLMDQRLRAEEKWVLVHDCHVFFSSERIGLVGLMPRDLSAGSAPDKYIGRRYLKAGVLY